MDERDTAGVPGAVVTNNGGYRLSDIDDRDPGRLEWLGVVLTTNPKSHQGNHRRNRL